MKYRGVVEKAMQNKVMAQPLLGCHGLILGSIRKIRDM